MAFIFFLVCNHLLGDLRRACVKSIHFASEVHPALAIRWMHSQTLFLLEYFCAIALFTFFSADVNCCAGFLPFNPTLYSIHNNWIDLGFLLNSAGLITSSNWLWLCNPWPRVWSCVPILIVCWVCCLAREPSIVPSKHLMLLLRVVRFFAQKFFSSPWED